MVDLNVADGYSENGIKVNQGGTGCTDIDKCVLGSAVRFDNSFCKNTEGSYKFKCNNGWESNAGSTACVYVNECEVGASLPNTCNEFATCVNNDGSYECNCKEGFGRCTDLDECTLGTNECDGNATCTNTLGTYDCDVMTDINVMDKNAQILISVLLKLIMGI